MNYSRIVFLISLISFLFLPIQPAFPQAAVTENITITTYYPAPFGIYQQMITTTLGVGDNNNDGVIDGNDAPDPTTHPGDLWVRDTIGVGTTNPYQGGLHIVKENMWPVVILEGYGLQPSGESYTGHFISRFARGTIDSPQRVLKDDVLAVFRGEGWAGSDWGGRGLGSAQIYMTADDNFSDTNAPGRIIFYTTKGIQEQPRMVITSDGNIGIGTAAPQGALDVSSTTSAFIPPRMTTSQRNSISNPVKGMVIYNTNTNNYESYSSNNQGTSWGSMYKPDYDSGWFAVSAMQNYTLKPNQNTYYSRITVIFSNDSAYNCQNAMTGLPVQGGPAGGQPYIGCWLSQTNANTFFIQAGDFAGYCSSPTINMPSTSGWYRVLAWR